MHLFTCHCQSTWHCARISQTAQADKFRIKGSSARREIRLVDMFCCSLRSCISWTISPGGRQGLRLKIRCLCYRLVLWIREGFVSPGISPKTSHLIFFCHLAPWGSRDLSAPAYHSRCRRQPEISSRRVSHGEAMIRGGVKFDGITLNRLLWPSPIADEEQ